MKLPGLALLLISAASPAVAQAADASVTVLRGASPPAPADPQPAVVVQVYPQTVYLPAYDPGYSFYPGYFYPGYFIHPQPFARRPVMTGTMTGAVTGLTSVHK